MTEWKGQWMGFGGTLIYLDGLIDYDKFKRIDRVRSDCDQET